ncbi:lysostaphin resistance A-like protein [candidate division KSB1 bacterium]
MGELNSKFFKEETENNQHVSLKKPGKIKQTFVNRFGHIRAGWRMAIYIITSIFCLIPVIVIFVIFGNISPQQNESELLSVPYILLYVAINTALIISALVSLKLIDRRPFGILGINLYAGWFREFSTGLGLGFVLLTVIFLIFWITGLVQVTIGEMNTVVLSSMSLYLALFLFAGATEEFLMRGYLFQASIEGSRNWIAVLIFSLIFSLLHFANPNWSWSGAINIFLAGVLLSVAYIKTRSLWLPIGLHMAWNWTQGPLWGMNVSGISTVNSFLVSIPRGPDLLSGGEFGAEDSLISSVFITGLLWYVWKVNWIKPSPHNEALWQKYPAGYGLEPVKLSEEFPPST